MRCHQTPAREKKDKGHFENIEHLFKYNTFNVNAVKMTEKKQLKRTTSPLIILREIMSVLIMPLVSDIKCYFPGYPSDFRLKNMLKILIEYF